MSAVQQLTNALVRHHVLCQSNNCHPDCRHRPSAKKKRVMVYLSVLTRLEYSEVVTVPVETTEEELDDLVEAAYDKVDGGEYYRDVEYWEKSECLHEVKE